MAFDAGLAKPPRLASLDVLRGLTIVGMILVNSAAYLHYVSGYDVFPALMHSRWAGFTLADAVFPAFIFMTGVSIPLATAERGLNGVGLRRLVVRTGRLFLLGLLVSNIYWLATPESVVFRPMGVLQRIALAFLAAAVLYRLTGPRTRLTIAVVVLLLYWLLCLAPYPGGAADLMKPGASLIAFADRAVLGVHTYVKGPLGYDPEGLLGTLPAIAQALIGVAAGEWLAARRGARGLALAGALLLAVGIAWGFAFPVVKDLWTSSYVLISSGAALLVLAALHQALDVKLWRVPGRGFLTDFGVNAIFAYVLHELASIILTAHMLKIPYAAASPVVGTKTAALIPVAIFIALIWSVVAYTRRKNWIVKV
ncbi:acyltransferase family protein [Caulobacter sp. DWR1-3-2b1]|uniref:acyltransferase family protein n=1 Tax=Caulobacter sp. DWR1-3-2b1 TaxID=2804670 RepID=UPI003CECE9D1